MTWRNVSRSARRQFQPICCAPARPDFPPGRSRAPTRMMRPWSSFCSGAWAARRSDLCEPNWPMIAREIKRKGVTLTLLWQEYRAAHPNGYGFTWFCEHFAAFERRASPVFPPSPRGRRGHADRLCGSHPADHRPRHRAHSSGPDLRGGSGRLVLHLRHGQLSARACRTGSRATARPWPSSAGSPRAIVCDNLKAGVAKPLWFEPTLNPTFAALAEHYDTTILPTRSA